MVDFVSISPRVSIGGTTAIGKSTWIGIGSSVINNINITSNGTIGAGTCVIRDIRLNGIYYGIASQRKNI